MSDKETEDDDTIDGVEAVLFIGCAILLVVFFVRLITSATQG